MQLRKEKTVWEEAVSMPTNFKLDSTTFKVQSIKEEIILKDWIL